MSSNLELSRLDVLAVVMKYFTQMQRLQRCDLGVYGLYIGIYIALVYMACDS